jgi:hypothetical protein
MATKLKAKTPDKVEPSKPKILIFGASGVGKTWFSLDFPSCYYIDTEGGAARSHYMEKLTKSGGMIMGPEDGSLDGETVIAQFQALATEKHGFKTVVVDSITKLFNTLIANEQERLGDKDAFGASKKPAVAFMRRLMNWIHRLPMNVVLICHEKEEWGVDAQGNRTQTGTTFDCWDKVQYELDLAIQVVKQGQSRYGLIRKSRLQGFPDRERFALDFAEFSTRYGKDVIEAESKTIVLASAEQVSEIERLSSIIHMTEEEKQKWLTKASASDWNELTDEQAAKAINALLAKINPTK